MAISDQLFLAILSLDSYNRGYNIGTVVEGNALGTAQLGLDRSAAVDGFFAQSYTWNGMNVIAYRGTDNIGLLPVNNSVSGWSDLYGGWTLSAGLFVPSAQLQHALNFYTQVTGSSVYDAAPGNVLLTGHSLGGGLAGLVASQNGAQALFVQER